MSRVLSWLRDHDQRLFFFVNHKLNRNWISAFMSRITHLGGATFTIVATLGIWTFASKMISHIGFQAFISLALSHIPVIIMKKIYPRLRPYITLPEAITGKQPLKDHSFPSGHTTAIFSVITPFVVAFHWVGLILVPLAAIVGMSRMYLGLHYPTDVLAGCMIGCATAGFTIAYFG
jgi:undecaprenyl-diphosphatase